MTDINIQIQELIGGEVKLWIEQGSSIHLKSISEYGDPVELSSGEAKELAKILLEMANKIGIKGTDLFNY